MSGPEMAGGVSHERGASAPAAMVGGAPGEELKTRSLPTRCQHGARPPLVARRNLVLSDGEGGGPGSASLLCEEDGFYFNQPLLEEGEEDLYGSSEDLQSGPSILEKLMVWAYYNAEGQPQETQGRMCVTCGYVQGDLGSALVTPDLSNDPERDAAGPKQLGILDSPVDLPAWPTWIVLDLHDDGDLLLA